MHAGIAAWLKEHATSPEAQFVYKAWLDAKGDVALVETSLHAWLAGYGRAPFASFVLAAWLRAKGPLDAVWPQLGSWFKQCAGTPDALYVARALLVRAEELPSWEPLLLWLNGSREKPAKLKPTLYRWLDKGGPPSALLTWMASRFEQLDPQQWGTLWLRCGGSDAEPWLDS